LEDGVEGRVAAFTRLAILTSPSLAGFPPIPCASVDEGEIRPVVCHAQDRQRPLVDRVAHDIEDRARRKRPAHPGNDIPLSQAPRNLRKRNVINVPPEDFLYETGFGRVGHQVAPFIQLIAERRSLRRPSTFEGLRELPHSSTFADQFAFEFGGRGDISKRKPPERAVRVKLFRNAY
jgi:hypothetical protein